MAYKDTEEGKKSYGRWLAAKNSGKNVTPFKNGDWYVLKGGAKQEGRDKRASVSVRDALVKNYPENKFNARKAALEQMKKFSSREK
jgi:hypothetical protein